MTREEYRKKLSRIIGDESKVIELMIALDNLIKSELPPAEGAEPITEVIPCYACQGGGCPVCSGCGTLTQLAAQQQPTAEGAEEILTNLETYYDFKFHWIEKDRIIRAMQEFTTLHAQRIADKMVSERLREELIKYDKYIGNKGWIDNYEDETAIPTVDEYLKSRER